MTAPHDLPTLINSAKQQVESSPLYKKFIDGTPLANDIPVWMAEFAITLAKQLRDGGDEKYLIWSNEHRAWWASDSRGYCLSVANAGRYSKDEAIKICNGANYDWTEDSNPNELPIPESIAVLLKNRLLLPQPPASGGDDE